MKPSRISDVLDLAMTARKNGFVMNPSFTSHAGVGKTEHVAQWVEKQRKKDSSFGFIQLRLAYCEAPDFLGLPNQVTVDGRNITQYYTPEFWPQDPDSTGLIFIDEWNRATTAVMNCLMSMTDSTRAIGPTYRLPKGWIICGATNPESADYDTNTADTALKDRFEHFEIEYDHNGFVNYMERNDWCQHIQNFVKSGTWLFKEPSSIGKDGKYISPRTWSKLNASHKSGALKDKALHRQICVSVLGKSIGGEFWTYVFNESPVTAADLLKNTESSIEKLKKYSDPSNYRGDFISVTVESIVKNYGGKTPKDGQISEDLMIKVASVIPSDLAVELLRSAGAKAGGLQSFFKEIKEKYPDLVKVLQANIKVASATGGK
jgi:hypothetical protein